VKSVGDGIDGLPEGKKCVPAGGSVAATHHTFHAARIPDVATVGRDWPRPKCRVGLLSGPVTAHDFTALDQAGRPWTLSAHRGTAILLVFLRGDW
jgi:hypothetical protein